MVHSRPVVLTSLLILFSMVPLPCSGTSYLQAFRSGTPILPNNEIRAAWVVRDALASRETVDRAIDFAVRARFHLLFVQVRGRGDAYYQSDLEPAAADLLQPPSVFDPLAYVLERAHAEGIAVHAWVNVFYVWSDPDAAPPEAHVVRRHPEWLVADRAGDRMDTRPVDEWRERGLEGYYVSPAHPDVRRHTVEVIRDIVSRYPVDGVHLDYVRYPGPGFDFSVDARTRFMLWYGLDPLVGNEAPEWSDGVGGADIGRALDPLAHDMGETSRLGLVDSLHVAWRAAQVDSLVRMVRGAIADLPLSAAVIPDFVQARREKGQDWLGWVQRGEVDFVVPMAYTLEPAALAERIQTIKRAIGTERLLVGLPVFNGRTPQLGYSVSLLRREQILGYALFSYNALVEQRFSMQFLQRVFFGTDE